MESKNKSLVLEAFDTLFNKRDYAAAERYWSPNYIQHSAHIGPGREGLFDLINIGRRVGVVCVGPGLFGFLDPGVKLQTIVRLCIDTPCRPSGGLATMRVGDKWRLSGQAEG